MEKSQYRCPTPRCVEDIAKGGERYHSVYDGRTKDDYVAKCERCGGKFDGAVWQHKCGACGKQVEPGGLVGLFVPHSCPDCHHKAVEAEVARGAVCSQCHQAFSNCCC